MGKRRQYRVRYWDSSEAPVWDAYYPASSHYEAVLLGLGNLFIAEWCPGEKHEIALMVGDVPKHTWTPIYENDGQGNVKTSVRAFGG